MARASSPIMAGNNTGPARRSIDRTDFRTRPNAGSAGLISHKGWNSMPLPASLADSLELPVVGSPLFIVSGPELVIAQCKAGIVGSFPALNARPVEKLGQWLPAIENELGEYKTLPPEQKVAPYAVNQICHAPYARLEQRL